MKAQRPAAWPHAAQRSVRSRTSGSGVFHQQSNRDRFAPGMLSGHAYLLRLPTPFADHAKGSGIVTSLDDLSVRQLKTRIECNKH
jgi:hypothetical protein